MAQHVKLLVNTLLKHPVNVVRREKKADRVSASDCGALTRISRSIGETAQERDIPQSSSLSTDLISMDFLHTWRSQGASSSSGFLIVPRVLIDLSRHHDSPNDI